MKPLPSTIPPEFAFPGRRGRPSKGQHASSGLYVKSKNGLQLRDRKVQRLLLKLKAVCPWLQPSDEPAARAWCEIEVLGSIAHALLRQGGLLNSAGDPKRLLGDYLRLRGVQLQFARELGLTPAARAAIGANNGKAPYDLALAMATNGADVEDAEVVVGERES